MNDPEMFERPVTDYMTDRLATAGGETPVGEIARVLDARMISAVPVVDEGVPVGVVSRTDLIRIGVLQAGRRGTSPAMPLPHRCAREVMNREVISVAPSATVRDAARMMVTRGIHRVFVTDGGRLVGVISAIDVTRAVRDAGIELELSTIMTSPIATIDVHSPLGAAVELLEQLQVTGLIVTDDDLPVGMFTQADALACRDVARGTPIEDTYDAAVLCLPAKTALHRAAHATQLGIRRVVACKAREAVGIVTALDFAGFAAR